MTESFTSTTAELKRIDYTGTIWFGAAIIATGIPLSGLLSSGWRPGDLPVFAEAVWGVGALIALVGTALLAWAGCPVLAFTPERADRQKAFSIRAGVMFYLGGSVLSLIAILASPAGG